MESGWHQGCLRVELTWQRQQTQNINEFLLFEWTPDRYFSLISAPSEVVVAR